jgi:hypothetical protein
MFSRQFMLILFIMLELAHDQPVLGQRHESRQTLQAVIGPTSTLSESYYQQINAFRYNGDVFIVTSPTAHSSANSLIGVLNENEKFDWIEAQAIVENDLERPLENTLLLVHLLRRSPPTEELHRLVWERLSENCIEFSTTVQQHAELNVFLDAVFLDFNLKDGPYMMNRIHTVMTSASDKVIDYPYPKRNELFCLGTGLKNIGEGALVHKIDPIAKKGSFKVLGIAHTPTLDNTTILIPLEIINDRLSRQYDPIFGRLSTASE